MADIIIKNGSIITMDPARRVIEKGGIAIEKDKITAIGAVKKIVKEHRARKVIDARGMVVMPGLVDTYGNAGHAITKNIGEHISGSATRRLGEFLNNTCTSEEYWYAEGQILALEHLKFGTTCFINRFVGANVGWDTTHPEINMRGIASVGLRQIMAVGAGRPPFPVAGTSWRNGRRRDKRMSLEECFRAAEGIIRRGDGADEGRTRVWVGAPRLHAPTKLDPVFKPEYREISFQQAKHVKRLTEKYGVGFHVNAYGEAIEWGHEKLKIFGPNVVIGHGTGLSKKGIEILRRTDTKVAHCPTARRHYSYAEGCPVVELIDAGVTVGLSSDYTAQDRTGDNFRDMKVAIMHQRQRFHDPSVLPPGKVLEMATIDGARVLGLDRITGSLEVGKKADLLLINMEQPHLKPLWMIPQRVAYQVTGHDVDTVLVDGKILMEGRKVKSVNEKKVLRDAEREGAKIVERCDLKPFLGIPDRFWGHSRY